MDSCFYHLLFPAPITQSQNQFFSGPAADLRMKGPIEVLFLQKWHPASLRLMEIAPSSFLQPVYPQLPIPLNNEAQKRFLVILGATSQTDRKSTRLNSSHSQ